MFGRLVTCIAACAFAIGLLVPTLAYADEGDVVVSAEGDAALVDGASFAASDFSRAQRGSNREIDGVYFGYTYYMGSSSDKAVAVATSSFVIVFVPESASDLADVSDEERSSSFRAISSRSTRRRTTPAS